MAQKFLKKKQGNKNQKKLQQPKIKKNKPQTLYNKMVHDENRKITKTINKNIEEQMMEKAKLNQEQFKLLKTKTEKKKQQQETQKNAQ